MRAAPLVSIALLLFGWRLAGQTLGEITGEVRDPSGGTVAGAAVTVTNQTTAAARTVNTNQEGVYSFPSLPPGVYDLKVAMKGFQVVTRRNLELQVQQTARIDFTLPVGQITETVEITGGAPLLTTENATVGTVIENRRIVELPLNGRNFLQLVALSPNVSFGFGASAVGATGDRSRFSSISIGGQRPVFNHFTLDGLENTYAEGNSFAFMPSIDALQEFKVQTGVYPAEFGRAIGQINVSTKPGGNEYHGTLFEFLRNDKLDAKAYAFTAFRPPKDPFRWNQYGFTLGGPIWIPKVYNGHNRLFFMSNFEGFRDRKQLRIIANVATPAMREGDFSGIPQRLFDPASHARQGSTIVAEPLPNNRIPANRIPRISKQLLEFFPEPNQPGAALASNYQIGVSRLIDRDQFNQRIDFIESSASSWFGRYSWSDELVLQPGLKLNGAINPNQPWQAMISNTRILSSNLVNEFRTGVNRFTNNGLGELASQRDVVAELNIPGVSKLDPAAWGIPAITNSGLSTFGGAPGGTIRYSTTFQWVDNVSWVRGKHTLRFGGEIRRDRWNASSYTFGQGQFDFFGVSTQNPAAPAQTGYAFADFMLGYMGNSRAGVTQAFAKFRATSHAYYIDDNWKIRPNLTLNFGLRYENTPPWYDRSQRFINVEIPFLDRVANVQDINRHPVLVRIGSGDFYEGVSFRFNPAIRIARDGRLGKSGVATDYNDFAPRLGIAWSPTSRWTIRAGGGVFYSQDTSAPKLDPARNLAGFRSEQADSDFPNLTWEVPFAGLGAAVQVNTPSALANQPDRRTPYTIQYLLNVQREVMSNTVLEIGYLGSVARKLEQWHNFNAPEPSPTGSINLRAPWREFGRVFQVGSFGKANYNSLAAKLQRRFSAGLTYLTGYTWSRAIDTGSGIRVPAGDTQFFQNEFCQTCDRALSSFHTSHRFVTSMLYELPFGKGKRFLNGSLPAHILLGGWQIGSIVTVQTGFPVNVLAGRDQCNCGQQADRVDATGQPTALPRGSQDPERFFNTNAYALQPFGSYGNSGRNTLMGPGIISWDFSTIKEFSIGERRTLEFRFEAFNLPNHPNWGPPNSTFVSPDFGKVRSTRTDMRDLQFGLKFMF